MRRAIVIVMSAIALVATGVVGAIAVGGTGTVKPPPRIAFLANGIVPADALAAGAIAGQLGAPLFTTRADTLNTDARDGITAYGPELVIVLGGPVAISEDVVAALSTATGLSVTTAVNPTDGIVRVAGDDRFATARAVADLLADYDPAYLPVGATALGAVDAERAESAATADAADDSDLLDGLDSTAFQPVSSATLKLTEFHPLNLAAGFSALSFANRTELQTGGSAASFSVGLPLAFGDQGLPNLRLQSLQICTVSGAAAINRITLGSMDETPGSPPDEQRDLPINVVDGVCLTHVIDPAVVVGPDQRTTLLINLAANSVVEFTTLDLAVAPTSDAPTVTPEP